MKLKISIRLTDDQGEKVFGPGVARLLRAVAEEGSLNQAAKAMELSYSKAWKILRNAEAALDISFLERTIGGVHGGGSQLTREGQAFLERYEEYQAALNRRGEELFRQMFPERNASE